MPALKLPSVAGFLLLWQQDLPEPVHQDLVAQRLPLHNHCLDPAELWWVGRQPVVLSSC